MGVQKDVKHLQAKLYYFVELWNKLGNAWMHILQLLKKKRKPNFTWRLLTTCRWSWHCIICFRTFLKIASKCMHAFSKFQTATIAKKWAKLGCKFVNSSNCKVVAMRVFLPKYSLNEFMQKLKTTSICGWKTKRKPNFTWRLLSNCRWNCIICFRTFLKRASKYMHACIFQIPNSNHCQKMNKTLV